MPSINLLESTICLFDDDTNDDDGVGGNVGDNAVEVGDDVLVTMLTTLLMATLMAMLMARMVTVLSRWEAVYSSDEEGEAGGAETGAVSGGGGY